MSAALDSLGDSAPVSFPRGGRQCQCLRTEVASVKRVPCVSRTTEKASGRRTALSAAIHYSERVPYVYTHQASQPLTVTCVIDASLLSVSKDGPIIQLSVQSSELGLDAGVR